MYKVFQVYFGYPSAVTPAQKLAYGRAIRAAIDVIVEVVSSQRLDPIDTYIAHDYALQRTVGFLSSFRTMARAVALGDIELVATTIHLDRNLFQRTRKRGLDIDLVGLYDTTTRNLIIPTFGPSRNMAAELGVFLTLQDLGTTVPPLPPLATVTYWDLQNGQESFLAIGGIVPADLTSVLEACARILSV
jgi:hypothetical protein